MPNDLQDRLRRIGVRQAGLLALLVALAVASVVIVGRELGADRQAGSRQVSPSATSERAAESQESIQPLTLSLDAAPYCETGGGVGFIGAVSEYDEDGNPVGRTEVDRFYGQVAETPVRWTVSGGAAPYRLKIDNEHRDGRGPYEEATGVASVSCALDPGEVIYNDYEEERRYPQDPVIDSGWKTIRAVVTDARGATAAASIDIYVILQASDSDTPLTAGETYRLNGTLFTIPDGVEARIGGYEENGDETIFDIVFYLYGYKGIAGFGVNSGSEIGNRRIGPLSGATATIGGQGNDDDPEAAMNSLFDSLVVSIHQAPAGRTP